MASSLCAWARRDLFTIQRSLELFHDFAVHLIPNKSRLIVGKSASCRRIFLGEAGDASCECSGESHVVLSATFSGGERERESSRLGRACNNAVIPSCMMLWYFNKGIVTIYPALCLQSRSMARILGPRFTFTESGRR